MVKSNAQVCCAVLCWFAPLPSSSGPKSYLSLNVGVGNGWPYGCGPGRKLGQARYPETRGYPENAGMEKPGQAPTAWLGFITTCWASKICCRCSLMFCQGRKEILGYSQNDPKLKTLLLNVDMVLTNEDLKEQDLWLCRFPSFDVLLFRNLTPQDCEMRVVEKLAKTFDKMVVSPTRPVDGPLKRQKPLEDDWGKLDVICCRC